MGGKLKTVSDQTFHESVTAATELVLVAFGGDWCPPCVALEPVLLKLADEWAGRAFIYKMDTETSPETPAAFGVRGLPTVLIFKNGQVVERLVGLQPRKAFLDRLLRHAG